MWWYWISTRYRPLPKFGYQDWYRKGKNSIQTSLVLLHHTWRNSNTQLFRAEKSTYKTACLWTWTWTSPINVVHSKHNRDSVLVSIDFWSQRTLLHLTADWPLSLQSSGLIDQLVLGICMTKQYLPTILSAAVTVRVWQSYCDHCSVVTHLCLSAVIPPSLLSPVDTHWPTFSVCVRVCFCLEREMEYLLIAVPFSRPRSIYDLESRL